MNDCTTTNEQTHGKGKCFPFVAALLWRMLLRMEGERGAVARVATEVARDSFSAIYSGG